MINLITLIFISLFFLFINWFISNRDYLNPTVIMISIATFYQIMILFSVDIFSISLVTEVVYIFLLAYIVITAINILSEIYYKKKYTFFKNEIKYINIGKNAYIVVIIIQLLFLYNFYSFQTALVNQVFGGYDGLTDLADKFQLYEKFREKTATVSLNFIGTQLLPLFNAVSFITIYIAINNYFVNKRINIYSIIIIVNLLFYYTLSGSRTPVFRVITFAVFLYIYLNIKSGRKYLKLNFRVFFNILTGIVTMIFLGVVTLSLIGRSIDLEEFGVYRYIFIYTAAPIVNLSNFIRDYYITSEGGPIGLQTLSGIHHIIYRITDNPDFMPLRYNEFLFFANSDNGYSLGNVYTTFFMFLIDNGYLGIVLFTSIVFVYYNFTHKKIMNISERKSVDFIVFLYAYMFNDLLMLLFSNRFFETMFNISFFKFMAYALIICIFINKSTSRDVL